MTSLDYVLMVVSGWLLIGLGGLLLVKHKNLVTNFLFPAGAALGFILGILGLTSIFELPQTAALSLGIPGLPFHLRIDSLSACFLTVFGMVVTGVSLFSAGYFRHEEETPAGLICLEYHICIASIATLLIADDAFVFMFAWEIMSLTATLLVITHHRDPEVRFAGFLYFLMAHVGALMLVFSYGIMAAEAGSYTFEAFRQHPLNAVWASAVFFLGLAGFGAKAGFLPLHIWLPEAHPAAPSPISALLSSFLLKTGIYGILRLSLDLLNEQIWWWGAITLGIGLATALFAVILSAAQTDMKRLLAYSSIENVGLIMAGIGLAILFHAYDMDNLAALSLTAALYHIASHAAFKCLLFLGTGAVLHATGERNLGRLGGLMRTMPWTAWTALVGALAAGGLPPFGGFISEWLLLQSFLFTPGLPNSFLNMLVPVVTAVIVLVGALAAYVMVKYFGVIFLGTPREQKLEHAHDAGIWERLAFVWLVIACIFLGLFPLHVVTALDRVTTVLVGQGLAYTIQSKGWLLLVPDLMGRASYMPLVFALALIAGCWATYLVVRWIFRGIMRRTGVWACGYPYPWLTARMQDTAEGFGQPIRNIFGVFFSMKRKLPSPFDRRPVYEVKVEDPFWGVLYRPIAAVTELISRFVGLLQYGRIAVYLSYTLLTLMLLLLVINR